MTAYYNEFDPYAAQWLRNLIAAGHIAPGDVDERDIQDVRPDDIRGYTQCHFFAGIGVWSLALRRAGWPDDRSVWTGSCPCQPFSSAGKGLAFDDDRHIWPAFYWLIQQRRPAVVLGEQVASKNADAWIDLVHADMEALGDAFGAIAFPAASIGAPNIRERTYWVAHAKRFGVRGTGCSTSCSASRGMQSTDRERKRFWSDAWASGTSVVSCADGKRRPIESGSFPVAHGATARVGRLRAYGNAINAIQAQIWCEIVMDALGINAAAAIGESGHE